MIINDFELIKFLNKNINIFILSDDSLRSYIILKIIKIFFKKKCFSENFNDFDYNKYNNSIIIFRDFFNDSFNKKNIYKLVSNNNIVIFILQNFKHKYFIKEMNYHFKKKIIIILFDLLTKKESFSWIKQFFIYNFFYFNEKILNYLNRFFNNDIDTFITTFESKICIKKTLLDLLLNVKLKTSNEIFFLENLNKKKINISLYTYRNTKEHIILLKNYNKNNNDNKFILYLFIILDINTKNNITLNSELILFNFMIDKFFEKNYRNNNFDKFNIKYFTKK